MKLEFSYDVCVYGRGGGGGYAKKPKHFQKDEGREVKICIFFAKVHSRRSQKRYSQKQHQGGTTKKLQLVSNITIVKRPEIEMFRFWEKHLLGEAQKNLNTKTLREKPKKKQ